MCDQRVQFYRPITLGVIRAAYTLQAGITAEYTEVSSF